MAARPPQAPPVSRPEGRDAELAALESALQQPSPAVIILEGPEGAGASELLAWVAQRAAQLGHPVEHRPSGARPSGSVEPGVVLCVDEGAALDASGLRALPAEALVVLALRTGTVLSDPVAFAALRARPTTRVLPLGALDREAVRGMLRTARPGLAREEELATACHALTGGNAVLVHRVLSTLTACEDPREDRLEELTAPLLDAVAERWDALLEGMGSECGALAGAATLLADETPLWVVAEVAGLVAGSAAAPADALQRLGFLRSADPVRLASPLLRRAFAARPSDARDQQRRRRAARLLGRTAEGLSAAADHLLVLPPGGEPWAVELLGTAADHAAGNGDHARAAACLARALAEPLDQAERLALLLRLGRAHENAGTVGGADAFREALLLAGPGEHAPIHLRLGRARFGTADYRGSALELERGLAAAGPDEIELTGELVAAYVAAARFDRTLEDAAARHLAPLLAADVPGRTAAERALLAEIALEQGIRGEPSATVITLAERAWADGLLLEGADEYGIAVSQVAAALTWSDAFRPSIEILSATHERAERDGAELVGATARYLRAWPRWYLGDLDGAEADVRAALDADGWRMYEASARAILGHVLIDRGELVAARAALELSDLGPWERTVPYAMLLETRSRLHLRDGELEAAAADLEQAGALLGTMGNASPFCPWRSRLGMVLDGLGETERGLALIDEELAQAERIGLPRARGVALHRRALIGGAEVDALRLSCELLGGCGARLEHARALLSLGCALAAAGDRAAARASLHEAHELSEGLGAADLAAMAARELHRAGGRPSRTPRGPGTVLLTASELRVARLAAQGMTNRAIAEELVVTPHTVRFHLANVYRKLRVSGRDDLAAALAQL